MTRPLASHALAGATPLPVVATLADGLPVAIDRVAEGAPETHRHLRRQ
jgi:hypothetical protein